MFAVTLPEAAAANSAEPATHSAPPDPGRVREAAARDGLNVDTINDVIETALGGMTVTRTLEGRQRFPVRVRFLWDYRQDIEKIKRIPIPRAPVITGASVVAAASGGAEEGMGGRPGGGPPLGGGGGAI